VPGGGDVVAVEQAAEGIVGLGAASEHLGEHEGGVGWLVAHIARRQPWRVAAGQGVGGRDHHEAGSRPVAGERLIVAW
jgi:hypothetical protein